MLLFSKGDAFSQIMGRGALRMMSSYQVIGRRVEVVFIRLYVVLCKRIVMRGLVKHYISKLFMTMVLIDMGLGGPALQLWTSDS